MKVIPNKPTVFKKLINFFEKIAQATPDFPCIL